MTTESHIAATAVRDYAKARGWTLVPEALKDRLYVMNHARYRPRQLVMAINEDAPDYDRAIELALSELGETEKRPPEQILVDVQNVGNDRIAFRLAAERFTDSSIPLSLAKKLLAATENLLRTSACAAVEPKSSYAKLNRNEAQDIASIARFGHTQVGSFIINVACPVFALDAQTEFAFADPNREPMVRSTTKAMYEGLHNLVQAIESDSIESLSDAAPSTTFVSRNLCEALLEFADADLDNSLDVGFRWASALPLPGNVLESNVSFKREYFKYIDRVRSNLSPKSEAKSSHFVCTVEKLSGKQGEDLFRAGEVVLQLFDGTDAIKAKAMLTTEQYKAAITSHEKTQYVKVKGVLRPGRQPQILDKITIFELQQ